MSSKLLSRRDLAFVLYELLDADTLTSRPRFAEHSRETFDAALDLAEQIATDAPGLGECVVEGADSLDAASACLLAG